MKKTRAVMTETSRLENQPYDVDLIPEPAHQSSRAKIGNWAALIALVIISVGLFLIFSWSFDNTPTLVVKNSPFPTRTIREHPTANGVVFLDADFCKNKDIDGDLRISFVGYEKEVFLPIARESGSAGCHRSEVPILIPKDIAPGEYKIKFRVTYYKNPLKPSEVVEFESRPVIIDPTVTSVK